MPAYDAGLFLTGIQPAMGGDVTGGLVYAFGAPLAADTGLAALAGGFELLAIVNAGQTIFTGVPNPGPQ